MRATLRSRFLVYWTGKDLDAQDVGLSAGGGPYVDRLRNTLRTGLWMMPPTEFVGGGAATALAYKVAMTCFTEVLLSRVRDHAARYGRLGFAFDRQWVLAQGGSPVLYVRQHSNDAVAQRVYGALMRIQGAYALALDIADGLKDREFRDREFSVLLRPLEEAEYLLKQHSVLLKAMSRYGTDDFEYLEEAEWRIVHDEAWLDFVRSPAGGYAPGPAEMLFERWVRSPNIVPTASERPLFFCRFGPDDLAILIFPDNPTRESAWKDAEIRRWLEQRKSPLPMLTLDECESF